MTYSGAETKSKALACRGSWMTANSSNERGTSVGSQKQCNVTCIWRRRYWQNILKVCKASWQKAAQPEFSLADAFRKIQRMEGPDVVTIWISRGTPVVNGHQLDLTTTNHWSLCPACFPPI